MIDTTKLSPAGNILAVVATVFGARLTSGRRSIEENKSVDGSPTSKHLTGDAIDLSADSPALATSALGLLAKGGFHSKGTAPHYHFEVHELTVPLFVAGILAVATIARYGKG